MKTAIDKLQDMEALVRRMAAAAEPSRGDYVAAQAIVAGMEDQDIVVGDARFVNREDPDLVLARRLGSMPFPRPTGDTVVDAMLAGIKAGRQLGYNERHREDAPQAPDIIGRSTVGT